MNVQWQVIPHVARPLQVTVRPPDKNTLSAFGETAAGELESMKPKTERPPHGGL